MGVLALFVKIFNTTVVYFNFIYHTSRIYPNLFERLAQKKSGTRRWPGPDFPVGLKNTTLAYL